MIQTIIHKDLKFYATCIKRKWLEGFLYAAKFNTYTLDQHPENGAMFASVMVMIAEKEIEPPTRGLWFCYSNQLCYPALNCQMPERFKAR